MRYNVATAYAAYSHQITTSTTNTLYRSITDYALTVCLREHVNPTDAEDIAQEVTIAVWARLNSFNYRKSSFRTWVHRITLDRIADAHRKQARTERDGQKFFDDQADQDASEVAPRDDPHRTLLLDIRDTAGPSADLMDRVIALGDVPKAAASLDITTRAANQRLKRVGAKYLAASEQIDLG
jgi:RNA polymerase sigma-70 factor (ECF subfamily)